MRTNIGTKLKFGKEERVFRLEFISNQRISPQEFTKWKEACTEANISLPTIGKISDNTIFFILKMALLRNRPRSFEQVGHETMFVSSGKKHFFTIYI